MNTILSISGLSKSYGKIKALDNLNLSIQKGNVYGLLGPNGSGKTTTLSILLGTIRPDSGNFSWFDDEPLFTAKTRIGSLIETPNFYPYLSIEKNLRITALIKNIDENDIARVLSLVGLIERKNSRYDTLSFGMKQRLALASLLLGDPDVLVLDEPTNGLDPTGIAEVRNIIRQEASRGKTIILASHILDEVEKVCSHVAILKSGRLIANGKVDDLLNPGELLVISTERVTALHELLVRSGLCNSAEVKDFDILIRLAEGIKPAEINKFATENGFLLSKIESKKTSLEHEFLERVK